MKKKILGMLIGISLIVTAVPLVESLKIMTINPTLLKTSETKTAENWTEIQKLLALDSEKESNFGHSVSLSGDTALIGANRNGDTGSAYIFIRTGTTWTQQAKLLPSDGEEYIDFGYAVSLDGDTALIGAIIQDGNEIISGAAYVFTRNGTNWTQQAKLVALDGAEGDYFGGSVSLSGDTALIGAMEDDDNGYNSGSAYVFTRTGNSWTQQAKLLALDGTQIDYFGGCVSLDGDTALIGSSYGDSQVNFSGSAYVFTRTGTTWTQEAKLLASDGEEFDGFGDYVSLNANTALIGAPYDDDNQASSGSVYVFNRTNTTWTQLQKLLALDGKPYDHFGCSIDFNGNNILIGARSGDNFNDDPGSAYIFNRTGNAWTQQTKLLASDGAARDMFGNSVALGNNTALIGVPDDDDNGSETGSVYVFATENEIPNLIITIAGGIGINAVIINTGTANASIDWQIHVEGGLHDLINTTLNGTIDILAGESKTVRTGLFFGIGPIAITVRAADISETTEGIYFFIFSIVKIHFPWIQIYGA